MTIIGYCIPTTDILEVEAELDRVKRRIDKIGSSCYQKLFGYEAAFLYDQMALNVLKKPDSMTLHLRRGMSTKRNCMMPGKGSVA